jgi:hypothetical protein
MDNDCAKEIHEKLAKLDKLSGKFAALDEKVRGIENLNNERYSGLATKSQNILELHKSMFDELRCYEHEQKINKASSAVELLARKVDEGYDQNRECRKKNSELDRQKILIRHNRRDINLLSKNSKEWTKLFVTIFSGVVIMVIAAFLILKFGLK